MNFAIAAIMLFSQLTFASSPGVVARAEVPGANVVHVGQTIIIPLYDGSIALVGDGLRDIGRRRIPKRDLLQDLGRHAFGGYDAASDRGEAFVAERPGRGTVNVLLRLAQYKYPCASCRTVHYYYRVQ